MTDGTAGLEDFKSLGASVAQKQLWKEHLSQNSYYTGSQISENWKRFLKSPDGALQLSNLALSKYASEDWNVGCKLNQAILPKKYFFTIPYGNKFAYKKSEFVYQKLDSFAFVCQSEDLTLIEGFGIDTTKGLFWLVFVGITLSLIFAFLEFVVKKLFHKNILYSIDRKIRKIPINNEQSIYT